MTKGRFILAIDQGTSSTKSVIFDQCGKAVAKGVEMLHTTFFGDGFVEQDPEGIYENVLLSVQQCILDFEEKGFSREVIEAIGISNQRETFVVWDQSGVPISNAIVWQCKRSVGICERLIGEGLGEVINQKTGLLIDPYFSATKLMWLKEQDTLVAKAIDSGNAFFGTVDTWLLFKLTKGASYATDYTNASRTLFFNLHTLKWDKDLLEAFGLARINLPRIGPSSSMFGSTTVNGVFSKPVAITALVGDSHAAAFGEGCFDKGSAKVTLGTGSSILMNIGDKPLRSHKGMVTTVCWSTEDCIAFAFEGVIVSCGATIDWLKNTMEFFNDTKDTENMANAVENNGGVYLIPSFSGLGSPHWQMQRRAEIAGLTFSSTKNHIVRAALESIPFQIKDVITAMELDANVHLSRLHANGGITANRFVMQLLADLLDRNVTTIGFADVSALGAALLAGLKAGVYKNLESIRELQGHEEGFTPANTGAAAIYYTEWQHYINKY